MSTVSFGASKQAIADHYDLHNDFYNLWLDTNMVYSSALWEDSTSLEEAQIKKLDHHILQSKAHEAERILDIGCGWGAILERLHTTYNRNDLTGLTLSEEQAKWIKDKCSAEIDVKVEAWQNHYPEIPYDAMISIGAIEHFARLEDSEEQKQENYRQFFNWCNKNLVKGGRLSLQTFGYSGLKSRDDIKKSKGTSFLANEIFRETDPPSLKDIIISSYSIFEVVALRNDRKDYARTCKEWKKRLMNNEEKAIGLVGADKYKMYLDYLDLSYLAFEVGFLDLYRITFQKRKI